MTNNTGDMPKRPEAPKEIWAQFLPYDTGEICVDAYDHEFEGGIKYTQPQKPTGDRIAALEAMPKIDASRYPEYADALLYWLGNHWYTIRAALSTQDVQGRE